MTNVRRDKVIALLEDKKCSHYGESNGKEVWITPDHAVIRIPLTGDIPIDLVELITLELLNMGMWDYDYFLGEAGFNPTLN